MANSYAVTRSTATSRDAMANDRSTITLPKNLIASVACSHRPEHCFRAPVGFTRVRLARK